MVALLVFVATFTLSATGAVTNYTFNVPAYPLWTDTGLTIGSNDIVTIHDAAGNWTWGGPWFGPEGWHCTECAWDEWIPNSLHGELIGYVGPSPYGIAQGAAGLFEIGTQAVTLSGRAGKLWLGFNDDYASGNTFDNFGSVSAMVSLNVGDLLATDLDWDSQKHPQIRFQNYWQRFEREHNFSLLLGGTNMADAIGRAYETPISQAMGNYGPNFVSSGFLGQPASGATHILLVLDPDNLVHEPNESDNVRAVSLGIPDLIAVKLNFSVDNANAVCTYQIKEKPVPAGTRVGLYWARGPTAADILPGRPILEEPLPRVAVGTYTFYRSNLAFPPPLATHALLFVDPPLPSGTVNEAYESNNTYPVPLCDKAKTKIYGYIGTRDRRNQVQYGGDRFAQDITGLPYRPTNVRRAVSLKNSDTAQVIVLDADGPEGFFVFTNLDPGEYVLTAYSYTDRNDVPDGHFEGTSPETISIQCGEQIRFGQNVFKARPTGETNSVR